MAAAINGFLPPSSPGSKRHGSDGCGAVAGEEPNRRIAALLLWLLIVSAAFVAALNLRRRTYLTLNLSLNLHSFSFAPPEGRLGGRLTAGGEIGTPPPPPPEEVGRLTGSEIGADPSLEGGGRLIDGEIGADPATEWGRLVDGDIRAAPSTEDLTGGEIEIEAAPSPEPSTEDLTGGEIGAALSTEDITGGEIGAASSTDGEIGAAPSTEELTGGEIGAAPPERYRLIVGEIGAAPPTEGDHLTGGEIVAPSPERDRLIVSEIVAPPLAAGVEEEEGECDLSKGRWVRDPRGPMYSNESCRVMPEAKNCGKFGKSAGFMYWRWKPVGCEIPRFDARLFLEIVRGKEMVFFGDSLAVNQLESLLCLLSKVEIPLQLNQKHAVGRYPAAAWILPSHNFTLKIVRADFLVEAVERRRSNGRSVFDINLGKVHRGIAEALPEADYAVVSSGNWLFRENYFHEKGKLVGCVYCGNPKLVRFGWRRALTKIFRTTMRFIKEEQGRRRHRGKDELLTVLRTYTPSHFEHGSWFSGGYCNRTEPLRGGGSGSGEFASASFARAVEIRKIQEEEMDKVVRRGWQRRRFVVMDVTEAMMARADAHPGPHYPNKIRSQHVNDCLHWCLPGPVDLWNEVLLRTLKKDSFGGSKVV